MDRTTGTSVSMARAYLNSQIQTILLLCLVSFPLKSLEGILIVGVATCYFYVAFFFAFCQFVIVLNYFVRKAISLHYNCMSDVARSYLFVMVYSYFKILNLAYRLPLSRAYIFKLVLNYRLVVCLGTMIVCCGQPLLLVGFGLFLRSEYERETRTRVYGGGKKTNPKKKTVKSEAGAKKVKCVVENYVPNPDDVDVEVLNRFRARTMPRNRKWISSDTNANRKTRFDQVCSFKSNAVINPGAYLMCNWRDHTFTFGGKDKKFRCTGFNYVVAGLDGQIFEWKKGENTCLFDTLFGFYCNSVCVKTTEQFDCALSLFNEKTLKVTRNCINGGYSESYREEYVRWLGDRNALMSSDLIGPICTELNLKLLAVLNNGPELGYKQVFLFYGDRGSFNGLADVDLINGVITNVLEPPHFTSVESFTLSSHYKEHLPIPGEITIADVLWNFDCRGNNSHFTWVTRPDDKKIPVIPDVAGDLKKAPNPTRVVPTVARSTCKTSLRAKLSSEGVDLGETTRYSHCKPKSDLDTSAIDDLFAGRSESKSEPVLSAKTDPISLEKATAEPSTVDTVTEAPSEEVKSSVESTEVKTDVTDSPKETAVGTVKPLTIVTTAVETITPPLDRFVDVSGRLVWNIRTGIPPLIMSESEHSQIFKFLLGIWGDSGLTGLIYASKVVRMYIEMTHTPKMFFNNTRRFLRLVKTANYIGKLGAIRGYFTKMVEARKKIEGVNVMIDNPKIGVFKSNSKFFNRRITDSIQWDFYKTVEADEVFDYAAGVNQIHSRQILYCANLVEYTEVDWEDPEQLREFIATLSLNMKEVPLLITRYYVPYTKKFSIYLYKNVDFWSDEPTYESEEKIRKKVDCYVDIYGAREIGHRYDLDFNIIEKGPKKSPVLDTLKECYQEVKISDWEELYEFERIMLLATLSSSYKANNHNFMFDMGITVELCSPKVFSGSNTYDGISDRIDTVASSVCSKFHTNKLTAQYGVQLELNSIRVAKCIAKSYVEKLQNKQEIEELPADLLHKVRQAREQVKDVSRVYGNGPLAVNRSMKNVVPYNTNEVSDMPKMKPAVANFNICKSKDQRDCNPTVRKITAVTNYNVYGCLSPIPNTYDANNVREAYIKRIGCAVPEPCDAVKILLPSYVEHFLNCFDLKGKVTQTLVGEIERYMNWDTYKLTLRYDPCRLKELEKIRKEVDVLGTFDFNDSKEGKMLFELWTSVEAHVKWESYKGEMKYARMIFARVDWFKVMFGSYAKITQQVIYETLPQFCATNLPVRDLPKHMVDKYRLCSLILSTDFSSFEGHNYPWIMYNVFFKFLITIWGIEFDVELFICMGVMTSTNRIINIFVWCNIDAKVMSGEVWTSICNWITNVILISFIVECEGFCFNTGFFSHEFSFKFFRGKKLPPVNSELVFTAAGDDGMTGLPLFDWIDYSVLKKSDYLEIYGVLLKLDIKDGIAGSGFLSKVYSENDMQTLCDPIKQLAKGILPIKYANSKIGVKKALARARAMSLLYEFGSCPVVAAYARCVIRCTRNVQLNRALINLKKDDWYSFEKVMEAVNWYEENEKGKYDKIDVIGSESRQIVEDCFGIPVCTQLVMERYFNETDDTSYPIEFNVPCIDLVCPSTESEFYEKYTFPRKMDDRSLTVCVNYVPERPVIEDVLRTDSNWFDFLNRETCFAPVASCA